MQDKNFLYSIFREPKDIHRILVSGVLALILSHVFYLFESDSESFSIVNVDDYILVAVFWFQFVFCLGWCLFSQETGIVIYGRIGVIALWAILIHRVFYGVESLGSFFVNFAFLLGWSAWLPFALFGLSIEGAFMKLKPLFKKSEKEKEKTESSQKNFKILNYNIEKVEKKDAV
jgi:hypothetical protein